MRYIIVGIDKDIPDKNEVVRAILSLGSVVDFEYKFNDKYTIWLFESRQPRDLILKTLVSYELITCQSLSTSKVTSFLEHKKFEKVKDLIRYIYSRKEWTHES